MQVMTVVEGKIAKTRVQEFLSMYQSVRDRVKPPGWKRSMLLRDTDEEGLSGYLLSGKAGKLSTK